MDWEDLHWVLFLGLLLIVLIVMVDFVSASGNIHDEMLEILQRNWN